MDTITCSCGALLQYCASGVVQFEKLVPDPRKAAWKALHRPHLVGKFKVAFSSAVGDDDEDNLMDGDARREDCEGIGMADNCYDMGYA